MDWTVYLLLSALMVAFSYWVFRVVVRRDYSRNQTLSLFAVILEFLVFALHANLSYGFLPAVWPSLPALPDNLVHSFAGLTLIFIGLALTLSAMGGLGFGKALGQNVDTLHLAGFYRYSRNPQIVGYSILLIGYALLWASPRALLWLLVYVVIAHLMVTTEEEHLLRIYGSEYEAYCQNVPRYLRLPWSKKA